MQLLASICDSWALDHIERYWLNMDFSYKHNFNDDTELKFRPIS